MCKGQSGPINTAGPVPPSPPWTGDTAGSPGRPASMRSPPRRNGPSPGPCPPHRPGPLDCTTGHAKVNTAGPVPPSPPWTSDSAAPRLSALDALTACRPHPGQHRRPCPTGCTLDKGQRRLPTDCPRCTQRPGATGCHLALAPSPAWPLSLIADHAKVNTASPVPLATPWTSDNAPSRLTALDALTAPRPRSILGEHHRQPGLASGSQDRSEPSAWPHPYPRSPAGRLSQRQRIEAQVRAELEAEKKEPPAPDK